MGFGEFEVRRVAKSVSLSEVEGRSDATFRVERLSEPAVEFRDHKKVPDVREGITKFGSYDSEPHTIELVPICLANARQGMKSLIERLKTGKYKYRGAERTFAELDSVISATIQRLLLYRLEQQSCSMAAARASADWCGNSKLDRLFLVQTPEEGMPLTMSAHLTYVIKRLLLEVGIPCQMLDTGTLENPDWKDLNLALNITAKCGSVPWVLPENVPDADFFHRAVLYPVQRRTKNYGVCECL